MSETRTEGSSGGLTLLIIALVAGGMFVILAVIGLLIALLLPAVQKVRSAANSMNSANNLKVVGMALNNYAADYTTFPQCAIYGKEGEPLLSWRVAILPYLEQDALYKRFHLDEPWDSPHNKSLLAEMPAVYLMPSQPGDGAGMTHYQVIVGKGTMFEEGKQERGIRFADVTDGVANTALAVEAANSVPWTKPEDLRLGADGALPAVGVSGMPTFNVLFVDGSIRHFKIQGANPEAYKLNFRRLLLRNDGEAVDFSALE